MKLLAKAVMVEGLMLGVRLVIRIIRTEAPSVLSRKAVRSFTLASMGTRKVAGLPAKAPLAKPGGEG